MADSNPCHDFGHGFRLCLTNPGLSADLCCHFTTADLYSMCTSVALHNVVWPDASTAAIFMTQASLAAAVSHFCHSHHCNAESICIFLFALQRDLK